MSALNTILDYIVATETSAALQVGGKVLAVVKSKLPKKEDTVGSDYSVYVSGAEQLDSLQRIAFGSKWQVTYTVELTLVTPNDRDQLINLADHINWREAVRARYMAPGPIPNTAKVEIARAPFLDRSKLADGYDYTQVVLDITTYESRP